MMTSWNGNIFPRHWPFVWGIHRWPVNSPHKDQWRGALMVSFIYAWINGWVNTRDACDLRRYRVHYDVTATVDTSTFSGVSVKSHIYLTAIKHASGIAHVNRAMTIKKGGLKGVCERKLLAWSCFIYVCINIWIVQLWLRLFVWLFFFIYKIHYIPKIIHLAIWFENCCFVVVRH